jgi:fatty acid desaturase
MWLDDSTGGPQRKAMRASRLDDPEHAAHAWGRFRRMLMWNVIVSAVAAALGLLAVRYMAGPVPWFMALMTVVGIFLTVACAAVLMGLVFISAGTDHDASVDNTLPDNSISDDHL